MPYTQQYSYLCYRSRKSDILQPTDTADRTTWPILTDQRLSRPHFYEHIREAILLWAQQIDSRCVSVAHLFSNQGISASRIEELCGLLHIFVSWPICKPKLSPKRTLVWEQEIIFLWDGPCTGYIIDLYSLQGSHSFRNFRYGSPTNLIMRILERNVLHSTLKGSWETYRASTTCRFCVRNISTYLRRGDDEVGNWPYFPPTLDITPFITLFRLHFRVHRQNEEELTSGYRNLEIADMYSWCSSESKGSSAEQGPSYVAYGNSASVRHCPYFRNQQVNYHFHRTPPTVAVVSQMSPFHTLWH